MPFLNIHYRTTLDPHTDPDHAEKALNEIKKFWALNIQAELDSIEAAFKKEFPTYKISLPDEEQLTLSSPIPETKTLAYQNSFEYQKCFEYISENLLETETDTYDKSEEPELIPWDERFVWEGSFGETVIHPLYNYPQWEKLALLVDDEEGKANYIFLKGLFDEMTPYLDDEGIPQLISDGYHLLG